MPHKHNAHMQDCISQCDDCHDTCQETLYNHCLAEGGDRGRFVGPTVMLQLGRFG